MTTVFIVCAAVGGTILFCQIVITLIGLGGEALDIDLPEDIDGDLGGEVDLGGDVDLGGEALETADHPDPSHVFGVLSFRTIVAALTFFGLAGLAADSAEAETGVVWAVAFGAGAAALYGVYWMMRGLYKLRAEGTVQIRRAVGKHGTVYVPIPAHESGAGKIQVNVQNRTAEYLAMTPGDKLPTGAKIVVVNVITPNTVEVEPVLEPERSNDE